MARILVVDDEPHLRLILQKQLEKDGYDVITVEDGFQAISFMRDETPDLVLLDIMMPEMDGYDVMRWMKKNYRTATIPVIFLTARSGQYEKVTGLLEGVNDYLTKPYEQRELLARVRNTLDWSRLQRQASPLTGLPGNQMIQQEVLRRISWQEPFAFLYIDVDHFKSYNDSYGYHRGDGLLCRTAAMLCDTLDEHCSGEGFVGHVGGDDFVLITNLDHGLPVAHEIVKRFEEMVPGFYDRKDRERGFIEVVDRQGDITRFPFATVTIVVVQDEGGRYNHVGALGEVVSELKRFGKLQSGSTVVHDRRAVAQVVKAKEATG